MKIVSYSPTDFLSERYLTFFLKSLYGSKDNYEFFLEEYARAFDYCCTSTHIKFYPIAFFQDEKIVAHAALIIDDRLPQQQAFFGFLELVDDVTVFEFVWQEITAQARFHGVELLKGPVNGSVWHQYRCVKNDSSVPFFKTEPISPLYYYKFLSQANPAVEVTYSSGIRESYKVILDSLKKNKSTIEQKLTEGNFTIKVTKEILLTTLLSIAKLSACVFNDKSWGYTKLDDIEFSRLYDPCKINEHIYKLFLLYHDTELIGYCSTMRVGQNLICKTICIASEFQGIGLGNALALKMHEEAKIDEIEKIMYVLVKDGNQVHNYPTEDVTFFRKYAVFDFKLRS